MTTTTKKQKRPPQPPCLCLECKREGCMGIGKPLVLDLEPMTLDLTLPPDIFSESVMRRARVDAIKASAAKLCTCPSGKRCAS